MPMNLARDQIIVERRYIAVFATISDQSLSALAQALPCVQEAAATLRAAASRGVGPDEKLPVPVDILMALRTAGALPDGAEAYLADAVSSAREDGAASSPASPVSPQQMTPVSPRPGLPPRSPASAAAVAPAVAKGHIPLLKVPRRAPPPPPPSSPTSPEASAPN